MFVFGVVSIEVWDTQFPVWAFVLALIIGELFAMYSGPIRSLNIRPTAFVYTIPVGMIQAITNQQIGLKSVSSSLHISPLTHIVRAASSLS